MPGVPTLVTYIGYKNEPPVVFDGFFFFIWLEMALWTYGSSCGEYKNEGNNYFYCRNLSYDTVVLQFYTKHICSSVEGWGNTGTGLAVYRMGGHGEKLSLPFLVFTFQPCIVMNVNSISKCKKTFLKSIIQASSKIHKRCMCKLLGDQNTVAHLNNLVPSQCTYK